MSSILSSIYEIIKTITFVLLAAFLIRYFVIQPFVVEGQSMEPNFHDKEYLVVEKLSYKLGTPKRGDVIIFQAPNNPQFDYIKRIIALPGETIKIGNNTILVNGKDLDEAYLSKDEKTLISQDPKMSLERMLSENEYFVLGDNRDHSSDSREFGILDSSLIIGKVWISVFPWQYFGAIPRPSY